MRIARDKCRSLTEFEVSLNKGEYTQGRVELMYRPHYGFFIRTMAGLINLVGNYMYDEDTVKETLIKPIPTIYTSEYAEDAYEIFMDMWKGVASRQLCDFNPNTEASKLLFRMYGLTHEEAQTYKDTLKAKRENRKKVALAA